MKKHLFIIFVLQFFQGEEAKSQTFQEVDSCRNNWKFFALGKVTKGKILFRKPAQGECGTMFFVSLTIVQLKSNELIRVLGSCDSDTAFLTGDSVSILPSEKPDFSVNLPTKFDEFQDGTTCCNLGYMDCISMRTFYGVLKKQLIKLR